MIEVSRAFLVSLLLSTTMPALGEAQASDRPDPDGPVVECTVFGVQAASPYVLPYTVGAVFAVWGSTSHFNAGNGGVGLYAVDFVMPIGTPIVAARAGEVVAVRDSFPDGNGVDLQENFIFIRHADSTVARYFHLTADGADVALGELVTEGQPIGHSGNTGQSTGPHLHFDVQQCGPNLPPEYNRLPCGQTVPLVFRNTEPHTCGVESSRRYKAW